MKFIFFFLLQFSFIFSNEIYIKRLTPYITPNNDGLNDYAVFKLNHTITKKISDYQFIIFDESNRIIKNISANTRYQNKKNFISSLFVKENEFVENPIMIPEQITWLGNDSLGRKIPDGKYYYYIKVFLSDSSIVKSPFYSIQMDSISPYSKLHVDSKFFSPNSDKVQDTFLIKQEIYFEAGDRWTGIFLNKKKEIVKKINWDSKSVPKNLIWDGKDDRGNSLEEGFYSYQLVGEDSTENKFISTIENIYLSKSKLNEDAFSSLDVFSPNEDGLQDSTEFKISTTKKNLTHWILEIYKKEIEKDKEVFEIFKSVQGDKQNESFVWDGKSDKDKVLSNGIYLYRCKFISSEGITFSPERQIEIDKTNRKIKFDIQPNHFTPDGDNEEDVFEILPIINFSDIKTWKLTLIQNYNVNETSKKEILKKWKGYGTPKGKIIWDGYSDSGFLINSLADLELHFSYRNSQNIIKYYIVKTFKTGILVTQLGDNLRISIPEYIFREKESRYISEFKSLIKKFPGYKVEIQSHSKQPGNNLTNMTKTEVRAKDIYQRMFGIEKDFGRYTYRGFGEVEPFFTEDDLYRQERNDRVDVYLIKQVISQ